MMAILILAVLGILLTLAELVLPGGIIGIGGLVCLIAAVVLTFTTQGVVAGAASIALLFLFGFFTLGIWMKYFHRLPFTKNLVLNESIDDHSETDRRRGLIGKEGVALTRIAPSGHIDIEGEKIDVMSESGAIEKGTPVRIVAARGPSIFVERREG